MKKMKYAPVIVAAISSLCISCPTPILANETTPSTTVVEASQPTTSTQDQSQYTAPNNVEKEVPDENKQGTSIDFGFFGKADIQPNDIEAGKNLSDISKYFGSFGDEKADDLVVKGDLSIAKSGEDAYDTQDQDTYQVEKNSTYNLKADLDVSQITNTINGMSKMVYHSNDAYVNHLETGMRATFSMDELSN